MNAPLPIVRGVGLVTPLGTTSCEMWESLLAGRSIADHAPCPGEWSNATPRIVQIGSQAAREAIANAGWSGDDLSAGSTAFIVGTSKGSITDWLAPLPQDGYRPLAAAGGPGLAGMASLAAALGRELGIGHGPRLTQAAACASGLVALIRAAMLIRSREARRALVVAAESSLHPLFLGSFRRLGVLARDGAGCRPLDRARSGFLMSEAAAAMCLEAGDLRGGGPAVAVERYAMAADATHLTAMDPSASVLKDMLARVIAGGPVDLVHAHATGTPANDELELRAIDSALPAGMPSAPLVYSHKGALGHSLGASGLVSAVINCLSHRLGVVPPNCRTDEPIPAERVVIPRSAVHRPVRRSIAITAGFGGHLAAVSLCST